MAGMSDEIGDVISLWQFTRVRSSGVEHDHFRARAQIADESLEDFADEPIRHRHDNGIRR